MAVFSFIGKGFKSIGKGIKKSFSSPEGLVTAAAIGAGFAVGGPPGAFAVAQFASYSGLTLGVVGAATGSSSLTKLGSHIGTVGVVGLGVSATAGGVQQMRAGTRGFTSAPGGAPSKSSGGLFLQGAGETASEGSARLSRSFNRFKAGIGIGPTPPGAPFPSATPTPAPTSDGLIPLSSSQIGPPAVPGATVATPPGVSLGQGALAAGGDLAGQGTKGFFASLDPSTKAFLGVQAVSSLIGGIGAGITQGEANRIQELLVRGNLQQAKQELDLANRRFVQNTKISPRDFRRTPDVSLIAGAQTPTRGFV